jgi:phage gp29-like protein
MDNFALRLLQRVGVQFRATPPAAKTTTLGPLASEQAVDWLFSRLFSMPDPDEMLRRAGINRAHLRVLTSDDEISQTMDTRNDALVATAWRFETPTGTDQAAVDWLSEQWEDQCDQILRGCMSALPYGYAVQEAVYEVQADGKIGWKSIAEKPFEWFVPHTDGTVLYRSKTNFQGEVTDPRKYFLTVRHQTYRNPYGEALFSRLYWPWFFRQQGWRFWVKWLERFGMPLLIGKGAGDAKQLATALSMAVQDAAIAVGTGTDVQVVSTPGGADHFEKFDAVICRRIQKLVLGQTLTSDMTHSAGLGGTGAAKVHDEVRMDKRDADAAMCTKTVQQIVNTLWVLNGFASEPPKFVLQDDTGLEAERADRDSKLSQTGVCTFTDQYLERVYDFEPGDVIARDPSTPPPGSQPPPGAKPPGKPGGINSPKGSNYSAALAVVGPKFTAPQQAIEDRVAQLAMVSPIPQALIREAIMAANDPNDLVRRLAQLFAGHSLQDFNETLERAMYAADIMGYAHAQLPPATQAPANQQAAPIINIAAPPPAQVNVTVSRGGKRRTEIIERDEQGFAKVIEQTEEDE